jgi:hypothetical protein
MSNKKFDELLNKHFECKSPVERKGKYKPKKIGVIFDEHHNKISVKKKKYRETPKGYPLNRPKVLDVINVIQSIKGITNLNVFSTFRELYVNQKFRSLGWTAEAEEYEFVSADIQQLPHLAMEATYDNKKFWKMFNERALENIVASIEFTRHLEITNIDYKPLSFFELNGLTKGYAPALFNLNKVAQTFPKCDKFIFPFDMGILTHSLQDKYFGRCDLRDHDFSKLIHFSDNPSYVIYFDIFNLDWEYAKFEKDRHLVEPHVSLYIKLDNCQNGYTAPDVYAKQAVKLIKETEEMWAKIESYSGLLEYKSSTAKIEVNLNKSTEELSQEISNKRIELEQKIRKIESEIGDEMVNYYRRKRFMK